MENAEASPLAAAIVDNRIDLKARFYEYFKLVHATTEALKREVYKLRFQVYCLETGFERKEDCQVFYENGQEVYLETDSYDCRSDHYLIRHNRSGLYAATVRLVLPDPGNPQALFPIEEHCVLQAP
ncbi:MAG: GNAT family N-acyltransferase, partial [Methylohalobius sp.]